MRPENVGSRAMVIKEAQFAGSSTRVAGKPGRVLPEFALIGRSNVGKSSLINMLCGSRKLAMTSSTPGKTRLINRFLINGSWYLVDLPGYGYAKASHDTRNEIASVIKDYILNSEELAILFVLVDSRRPIGRIDIDFIAELGEHGIPFAIILTKCDKQGPNVLAATMQENERLILQQWEEMPDVLCSSAADGRGRDEILDYIDKILKTI